MYESDLGLLRCPASGATLNIARVDATADDGEILEGELASGGGGHTYPITNGIPRFVERSSYNESWDYKWTAIDRGRGLNYRIADKSDPAYELHDIFDRNSHGGRAWDHARDKMVLDIGCGVGQYSWRLMNEYAPAKVVSVDLTRGIDIFRKIMHERFPHLKKKFLLVQGNVFTLPFAPESFDYVFSLGVLMHTGDTRKAVRCAAGMVKGGGQLNVWLYASEPVPYEAREAGRKGIRMPLGYLTTMIRYSVTFFWISLFRRLPLWLSASIIRAFSSGPWYGLCRIPVLGLFAKLIFSGVNHPSAAYRFINNFDGYCNAWADTWNEHEIFPVLKDAEIVLLGMSDWRLGFWGEKRKAPLEAPA